jgi:hypothetical protein
VRRTPSSVAAVAAWLIATGCSPRTAIENSAGSDGRNGVTIAWTIKPTPPVAGLATHAILLLRDRAHEPVRGARLQVAARMSHPGMAPVIAAATEGPDGMYDAQLDLTMTGDWILQVTGTLSDGGTINQQIEVATARPTG